MQASALTLAQSAVLAAGALTGTSKCAVLTMPSGWNCTRPDGDVEPLIWLYEFNDGSRHPFLFRKPIELPSRTLIRGVATGARIFLIPARRTTTR